MHITALSWLGTRTEAFAEMKTFCDHVLGLTPTHDDVDFAVFTLPGGDVVELFGPADDEHRHFGTAPVAGFLVDDLAGARDTLAAAGIELLSETIVEDSGYGWFHFRAPDGNVYELTVNPAHPAACGPVSAGDGR